MSTDPASPTPPATPAGTPPAPLAPPWAPYTRAAAICAVVGIALYAVAGVASLTAASGKEAEDAAKTRFTTAYLTGFIFWASLPLGGLALLMIGYLAKTSWGLLLRRPFEAASRTLPLLVVLWVPLAVLVATHGPNPYWWTHPADTHAPEGPTPGDVLAAGSPDGNKRELTVKTGQAMQRKAIAHAQREEEEFKQTGRYGFLSAGGFIGVGLVLFAIWGTMIFLLNKWGKEANETTDREKVEAALTKANKFSGPGLIVYALTITAAATQWVMSLEPGWSSTMFPVIFAVNQFLTCFAFSLALFLFIAGRSPFKEVMRPKFQLDMGTLLLAFTLFWSYTSFSQFMLVWVGNLPEEIPFFLKRSAGGWWWVSAALCVFHFALPFLLLLFRDIKLHPARLRAVAIYLLFICAIDVTWWIEPSLANPGNFPFFLMDLGAIAGIGGVWGLYFVWQLRQRPLLPASEVYRLPEGHHHEHH